MSIWPELRVMKVTRQQYTSGVEPSQRHIDGKGKLCGQNFHMWSNFSKLMEIQLFKMSDPGKHLWGGRTLFPCSCKQLYFQLLYLCIELVPIQIHFWINSKVYLRLSGKLRSRALKSPNSLMNPIITLPQLSMTLMPSITIPTSSGSTSPSPSDSVYPHLHLVQCPSLHPQWRRPEQPKYKTLFKYNAEQHKTKLQTKI